MALQLCDLIPGVMNCIHNVCGIHPGEQVLLLSDTTVDPDVVEAYRVGYTSVGGKVSVLTIPCDGAGATPHQITEKVLTGLFSPIMMAAIQKADLAINLTGYTDLHGVFGRGHSFYKGMTPADFFQKYGTRMLGITLTNKESLASDHANYPQALLNYLGCKAHGQISGLMGDDPDHTVFHVTDPQGTDLRFVGGKLCTHGTVENDLFAPYTTFGFCQVGILPQEPVPNAEGVVVSTSIHPGPVPKVKAYFEGGRVVRLEGGGEIGSIWQRDWEKNRNCDSTGRIYGFGVPKGPGNNWFEEFMWGVHPRSFRVGMPYRYQGSDAFKSWCGGIWRSGTIHFGIGGGKDESFRHRDLEIFYPTLRVNGTEIIRDGRLLLLDDPEVRAEAAKYGDPDELLTERWFPYSPLAE